MYDYGMMTVRLKDWDEHLLSLSSDGDWERCFKDAELINSGELSLLSGIPENDMVRQ